MDRKKRINLTPQQHRELWDRWKAGESVSDIGRALGRVRSGIHRWLASCGGIAPAARRRSPRSLSIAEREAISRGLSIGQSIRGIAADLGRAPSTVSREVRRHGGRRAYRAHRADRRAWDRALRPKRCVLGLNSELRRAVASKLCLDWSPEQISAWLKLRYPDEPSMRVSHETIYRSLFVQARGVLKKELLRHLRTKRIMRKSKLARAEAQVRGRIAEALTIRQRPAEAQDRAVPGHWEGDLLCGANGSQIVTLVERHSRFAMLIKIPNREAQTVAAALSQHIRKLPASLKRSLTWDRGLEMAKHPQFTVATNVKVYFCDPQSPWQRGSNENTNGLLRQYFPKGTDLSKHSQMELNRVALRLNQRPRETLGFQTPADRLRASVASTP
jgi:transposase, IS30 family